MTIGLRGYTLYKIQNQTRVVQISDKNYYDLTTCVLNSGLVVCGLWSVV